MASRSSLPAVEGSPGALSTRREFVVGGALAVTGMFASAATLRSAGSGAATAMRPLERLIPAAVGEWNLSPFADVLIPRAEKAQDKSYDEVVTRYYESRSAPGVMLLVAYGSAQTGDTQLHRPEACYPVAGFKLHRWPDIMLPLSGVAIPARAMTAVATGRIEQLLYWTRVGDEFPTSSISQRWAALRQTLRGSIPDGVLVRLSTIGADRGAALDVLRRFATELMAAGGPALRKVLTAKP